MGTYDNFNDVPDQIEKEGQEITLTYTRNGDGTATVCWNIPAPQIGCSAENQAYDGIVVTVSPKPVNYITTSPKDGTYYNADSTADSDLHMGDKIDYAQVVGAFYHDKETTCVNVADVADKTPYYFSAYAVDKVGRYHRQGVHAYSLPQNNQQFVDSVDGAAMHDIEIDSTTGITGNTLTGYNHGETYNMKFKANGECYELSIHGSDAMTYNDLVIALNKEFAKLSNPIFGPYPPNANVYIVDELNSKLFLWDGFTNTEILDVVFWDSDPSSPQLGTYWYNPETDVLFLYESGGWVAQTSIIKSKTDPRNPVCDSIWFDGTTIWQWDGSIWCELPTYIQLRNPLLPPNLNCSFYWFNSDTGEFFSWNKETKVWEDDLVIVYDKDPNSITTGDFWFNETDEKVYIYLTGQFNELNNIRYEEPDENGELPNPTANHYWYIPSQQILRKRNVSNTAWVDQTIVSYPTDPTDRESCDLWWNTSTSIDDVFKWDSVNMQWEQVDDFVQSAIDPSLPPVLEDNAAWYNPDTELIELIMGMNCLPVDYIFSLTDPTATNVGDIWYDTVNEIWYVWDGLFWLEFTPIVNVADPYIITIGSFWFDTVNDLLYQWDGSAWVSVAYSDEPVVPSVGTLWFDTVNEKLFEWNGTQWVETNPFVYVSLILNKGTCKDGKDVLCFMTVDTGCGSSISISKMNNTVITGLTNNVIWYEPTVGASAIDAKPLYEQLGVGTDGSPDERRQLHSKIRALLGKISVEVELTKEQIDIAIDNALKQVRKYSSYGYTRGFFFLDVNPNQQHYLLTNKCVGFNKIAYVNAIYRTGPFSHGGRSSGNGDNSVFGYGALQQLYSLQTFDILSYHLVAQYLEELEFLFARHIMFQWVEERRLLKLYQAIHNHERVLIDASMERPEQELMKDRELTLWIEKWALAESKMMLSQIRGKFQTLPGPNGSTTLNSQELITQAENEKAELIVELTDMGMQDATDVGMGAHFIIG